MDFGGHTSHVEGIIDVVKYLRALPAEAVRQLQRQNLKVRSHFRYRHISANEGLNKNDKTATDVIVHTMCSRGSHFQSPGFDNHYQSRQ